MIMPILAVRDVAASADFYKSKLGFTLDFSMPGPDGTPVFAGVSLGSSPFGLGLDPELQDRGRGVVFMVYVPDEVDLDAYYADVKARGTEIAQEIADQYWGDRTFRVLDPDGYVVDLCKTTKPMSMDEILAAA